MSRLLTGIMIALTAMALTGGFGRDVLAADTGARPSATGVPARTAESRRSGRVLGLLLTLEALRAIPAAGLPAGSPGAFAFDLKRPGR